MRYLAALVLLVLPTAAISGGAPGVPAAGSGVVTVEYICFPQDRFEICRVPVADGHVPGYLPRTVPSITTLAVFPNALNVFVTPNLVPYREAVQDAARAVAIHCGQQGGEAIVARIFDRERYAPEKLESWKFRAVCE